MPSAVKRFNGKPALITKDGRLHVGPKKHNGDGPAYVEMDINVADWCRLARCTVYTMFSTVPERRLQLAHVIESREDEHMPEQTLCCVQV